MQAGGGDILRMACILAAEAKLEVFATVHDALMALVPEENWKAGRDKLQWVIQEASRKVLGDDYTLGVDYVDVHYPNRYSDKRARDKIIDGKLKKGMSNVVNDLLLDAEAKVEEVASKHVKRAWSCPT